ncbi:hypothetical protein [Kitasatospora sp. NPDC097643]
MLDAVRRLGFDSLDTGHGRPVTALADAVLATVTAQHPPTRPRTDP